MIGPYREGLQVEHELQLDRSHIHHHIVMGKNEIRETRKNSLFLLLISNIKYIWLKMKLHICKLNDTFTLIYYSILGYTLAGILIIWN